ncbi:MAG: alpha/beta fold hydrolase [Ahrensia sp.]|nr:alpha/beta fold hydrolase [Ahrensia sp.]
MTAEWAASGHLSAGGKTLEYACWGPAPSDASTLVLLHEGLGCTALWRDFPTKLAEATGHGVFAYSRAGYGHSDAADLPRPLDYMTREAVDVLPQVLDAIGFERGILVGHSDGATIAAIYAGSVPDMRVRGIVTMAPHFFTEEMGLAEIASAKKAFASGDMRARMSKYHADPENTFRGWNDSWLHPDFKSWNVSEVIDYIRVPVLAIQGEDDQYGTLAQIEELKDRCYAPVDELVLSNCRHAPFLDQQEKVLAELADYCVRLERIEAATPEMA